jgi:hypothetical protein
VTVKGLRPVQDLHSLLEMTTRDLLGCCGQSSELASFTMVALYFDLL